MSPDTSSEVKLEIGHVLFIDIVRYSQLLITQQSEQIETLRSIVRGTPQYRAAEAEGKLLRLPTGDGAALVFRTTPEAPVLCALEIARELKKHPELRLRMGIHSGPVNAITDLNEQANIAGAGINIAQRVMDCGDAGHILLSRRVAEDLEHYPRWKPYLHDLGQCEAKHGVRISVVNFYTDEVGNPALPERFKSARAILTERQPKRSKLVVAVAIGIGAIAVIAVFASLFVPGLWHSNEKAKREPAEALPIAAKSIAVLPFDNLSRDPDNAYFVKGIQDEILTRLSKGRVTETDPLFFRAHYYLGAVLQLKGDIAGAIPEFQRSFDLNGDPYSLAMLGQAYARNGQKDESQKILARLSEEAKSRYVAPYALAVLYLGLGEKERALDELERAYQRGDTNRLFVMKVDPFLDDLRDHPRFQALLQKVIGLQK